MVVSGVCWANANVDALQTFAVRADMNTSFYLWNKLTAYSADEPITPAWNNSIDNSNTWTVNPCPMNWRLPTPSEFQQLNNTGTTWVDANVKGNAVAGRFYGYNHATCTLPGDMDGCVFFPAAGIRNYAAGEIILRSINGFYFSSMQNDVSGDAYHLYFEKAVSAPFATLGKSLAMTIRCVR